MALSPQTQDMLNTLQGQTPLQNLQQAYTNLCALIAWMTLQAGPTVSLDGESVDKAGYLDMLIKDREILKRAVQDEEGPWVVSTRMSV